MLRKENGKNGQKDLRISAENRRKLENNYNIRDKRRYSVLFSFYGCIKK